MERTEEPLRCLPVTPRPRNSSLESPAWPLLSVFDHFARYLYQRTQRGGHTGLAVAESLEQVVRQMQADIGLGDANNAAIYEAIRADNFADLIVPVRAFIPTTIPDQHRAQFDRVLAMITNIKEQFANIRRT